MHQSLDLLGSTSRTYLVNGKNVPNPIGDARWYIPPLRLEIVYHWWVYPLVIKPSHIFLDTRGYPWLVQPNVSPACWISCCSVAGISSCAGIIARRISHCAGIIASSVAGLRIVAIAGGVRLCCLGKVRKKKQCRWSGIFRESGSRWYVFIFAYVYHPFLRTWILNHMWKTLQSKGCFLNQHLGPWAKVHHHHQCSGKTSNVIVPPKAIVSQRESFPQIWYDYGWNPCAPEWMQPAPAHVPRHWHFKLERNIATATSPGLGIFPKEGV